MSLAILKLGEAGLEEPIVGGAIVFAVAGATLVYMGYLREEMNPGLMLRLGGFIMFFFALLALFWPSRPWPH